MKWRTGLGDGEKWFRLGREDEMESKVGVRERKCCERFEKEVVM